MLIRTQELPVEGPALALYRPPTEELNVTWWRINGFKAKIVLWTEEEWARLTVRPADAQYYPSGVWCALRMEE